MELEGLKYSELQRLAKQHGLKANLKADKLLKGLQEHFQQELKGDAVLKTPEEENKCNTVDVEKWEDSNVTKRRGKGRLSNESKEELNGSQNESVHLQAVTASDNEQPSMELSPHLEMCQNTDGSDSKRRQRKHGAVSGAESTGSVADGSATVTQCAHLSPERAANTSKGTTARSKTGKIPRFVGAAGKAGFKTSIIIGKTGLNHVTPDWKKIHQASFNKMESIDLYVERKRKRIEAFGNSAKQKSVNEPKNLKSTLPFFSPVHQTLKFDRLSTPTNQRKSPRCSAAAVTLNEKSVLPSVCSVTKTNVRFTDATKVNDKRGAMKTPTTKSTYTELSSNPGTEVKKIKLAGSEKLRGQKQTDINASNPGQTKVVTPYRFFGSTTPGTNKKFDLKASLTRPLTYKPHKGKLKSWEEMKENRMTYSLRKDHKQPKLQTRENRREKFLEKRKERKNDVISARRGLAMA
ncbi:nucleolar and spindle-associated protein 1 isoform X1 [Carcharodon carcharias]|uniref:nucleolar and spindle-associated protein 1 isoform X1 n=1 Tax=Carcharodon carcharias TaxID=13397 RepID=UPI001B7F28A6|nr:nucleolar and spindle-associated protein 1 isoform X1 [Carcharodon carcharias]